MGAGLERGKEEWRNLPVFAHLRISCPAATSSLKGEARTLAWEAAGCSKSDPGWGTPGSDEQGYTWHLPGQSGWTTWEGAWAADTRVTCHMPGWEPPSCALKSLGPHSPGLPPVGSESDTDPLGNWGESLCFSGPQFSFFFFFFKDFFGVDHF